MDAYDVTRMVYSRVQAIEPAYVSKIMGYLLLQDRGEQEMFRLAFCHDALIQALVFKIKRELGLAASSSSLSRTASLSCSDQQVSSPLHVSQTLPSSLSASSDYLNSFYLNSHGHDDRILPSPDRSFNSTYYSASRRINRFPLQDQDQLSLHDRLSEHFTRNDVHLVDPLSFLDESHDSPSPSSHEHIHPDMLAVLNANLAIDDIHPSPNGRRLSTSEVLTSPDFLPSTTWKPCLYYARGYCKHGNNCRFLHGHLTPDSPLVLFPSDGQQDSGSDDGIVPGSLEILELELHELLRGRKAPISIASLPQLYYERFGKILQADKYVSESQRHGKVGYSLTNLLSRLKNSIILIDRPHGQHAVVLAEDAYKFIAYRGGKEDLGGIIPGSRQIYLTFPAESAFTEEDVSAHFRVYGPVQDVRIPYQQKRMFGFVTFIYPETVKMILAKGNPHHICGARVLVKPYKEKGKHTDRKLSDLEYPRFFTAHGLDNRESDYLSDQRPFLEHDLFRRQLEEQEFMVELERRQLAELQLEKQRRQSEPISAAAVVSQATTPFSNCNGFSSPEGAIRPSEGLHHVRTSSAFEISVDGLDNNQQSEELQPQEELPKDKQSDEDNLPDSPFTSPHKSFSISCTADRLLPEEESQIPVSSAATDCLKVINCRICMGFFVDPMELDCGHVFCMQCILKVIGVSKDECPVCQRHIGSQIVKLLETRRLQFLDANVNQRGALTIW